jgi:hypothetical protein
LKRQQAWRWYLGAEIGRAAMACKTAHKTQSLRPVRGLDIRWLSGPRESQRLGNVWSTMPLHERDEVLQRPACLVQFESQAASQVEVILNGLPKRIHRTPPGQGKASVRNALMSTFE